MTDPTQIAAKLSKAQREAVLDLGRCTVWAFRPGSNLHPDFEADNGCWGASDLDAMYRLGVAAGEPAKPIYAPLKHPHLGEVEMDHRWSLTPLGQAVRSALIAEREGV